MEQQNIFLLCPSLYRSGTPERTYASAVYAPGSKAVCSHTNIPVFSLLTQHLAAQGEQIHRVVMLASTECHTPQNTELGMKSTVAYLQERFDAIVSAARGEAAQRIAYSVVTIDAAQAADTTKIQNTIAGELNELTPEHEAAVWVDFTSGLRTHAILLMFLLRFWETQKGAKIRDILYANISGGQPVHSIDSCMGVYNMFNLYTRMDMLRVPTSASKRSDAQTARPDKSGAGEERIREELDRQIYTLQEKLRNSSGDNKRDIVDARARIQALRDSTTDVMTMQYADNILATLPKGKVDLLSQVEYMMEQNMIGQAMMHLYSIAFPFLVDEGIICLKRVMEAKYVEIEVLSARFYYETFVSFMLEVFDELEQSDDGVNPCEVLERRMGDVLEEGRSRQYKAHPPMNKSLQACFREVCGIALENRDRAFVEEARAALENGAQDLLEAVSRYQKMNDHDEQTFMQFGFPMACTDYQKHSYSYDYYRRTLTESAQDLMATLNDVRTGVDSTQAQRLPNVQLPGDGYRQALAHCRKNLTAIIEQPYAYQSKERPSWTCGLDDPQRLWTFFSTYMPLHQDLRCLRNSYAHPTKLPEVMTQEQKEALARSCISMLRELSRS